MRTRNEQTFVFNGFSQLVALVDFTIVEKQDTSIARKGVHCGELS